MFRLPRILLVAAVAFAVAAPSAGAVPQKRVGSTLGALWEFVLETPSPENPFGGGDPCVDLDGTVAPFAPLGTSSLSCTVKPGTKIFITAESSECSTVEPPPFFGGNETQLWECARLADAGFADPTATVDGKPVPVREVETGLIRLDLPADNILGVPAQQALSVAHGWVAPLHPLPPGSHEIVIHVVGTDVFGNAVDLTNITEINVAPGR